MDSPPKSNPDKADRKWVLPAVLGTMVLVMTILIIFLLFYIYDLKNPTPLDVEQVEMVNTPPHLLPTDMRYFSNCF